MGSSHSVLYKSLLAVLDNNKNLVAVPNTPFYQAEKVKRYNLAIPVTPAAIVYPKTAAQVSAIIKVAVASGLKVQPRCGGHSFGNYCLSGKDGALVIDLKHFQHFSIDSKTWVATIGGGTLLGEVTKRLHDHGKRAMAHGICPQVGIGGHATIGGLGPSSRLFGACLDHIIGVEVVTADGTIKRASTTENSDLFWALKGAGASFGVITEFVCNTEPEPDHTVHFSFSFTFGTYRSMAPVFKAWQAFIADPNLSWNFASECVFTEMGMAISGTYFGSKSEFEALELEKVFPGHQVAKTVTITDWLATAVNWAETVALRLGGGLASPFYAKTLTFNNTHLIPDETIDAMLAYLDDTKKGTMVWFVIFDLAGGKVNTVAPEATSYAHRDALFYLQSYGVALDADGKVSTTLRGFLTGLNKVLKDGCKHGPDFGAYAGYVDPFLVDGQKEYWRYNLPKLEKIKAEVDPKEVFWNLQSVRPAKTVNTNGDAEVKKMMMADGKEGSEGSYKKGNGGGIYGKFRIWAAKRLSS